MAYKIYYKNTLASGSMSTHGKFEQYDRKDYKTEGQAKAALERYNKKFAGMRRQMKKEGESEEFQIRKTSEKKKGLIESDIFDFNPGW